MSSQELKPEPVYPVAHVARRDLIRMAGVVTAGMALPLSASHAATPSTAPPGVGRKFYADGRVHPLAGNTIICHLPQQGADAACFGAILDAYRDAPARAFMRKVSVLPPSSYHMTVFNGLTDTSRKQGDWPSDLPRDLPMAECNRIFAQRLSDFHSSMAAPIRMRIDPEQDPQDGGALLFRLQPFDESESIRLRRLRQELAGTLKMRLPSPDLYRFHITFGYLTAWFDDSELRELKETWRTWSSLIAERSPEIRLGLPEFCTFDDMFAFHRQLYLPR